jgi:hypothetical protein
MAILLLVYGSLESLSNNNKRAKLLIVTYSATAVTRAASNRLKAILQCVASPNFNSLLRCNAEKVYVNGSKTVRFSALRYR